MSISRAVLTTRNIGNVLAGIQSSVPTDIKFKNTIKVKIETLLKKYPQNTDGIEGFIKDHIDCPQSREDFRYIEKVGLQSDEDYFIAFLLGEIEDINSLPIDIIYLVLQVFSYRIETQAHIKVRFPQAVGKFAKLSDETKSSLMRRFDISAEDIHKRLSVLAKIGTMLNL